MKLLTQFLLFCIAVSFPVTSLAQQPTPATVTSPPVAERQIKTIPIEELLPANTLFFAATTNLAGLVENFRQLEAYKIMTARLPKSEREGDDNPLELAARFLRAGISDASLLADVRIGVAFLNPEFAPKEPVTDARKEAQAGPLAAAIASEVGMPNPRMIIFVEAASVAQAKKAREQFITFYSDTFTDLGKAADARPVSNPKFKGAVIEQFKNGYLGTMIGTTFVLGEVAAVESILTLQHATDAARLSDRQAFAQARAQLLTPTGLFAYLNGEALDAYAAQAMQMIPQFITSLSGSLFTPGAIKSVALSSTFERDGVVDRLLVSLDPKQTNLPGTIFSGPAVDFASTRYIPAGTQVLVNHSIDFTRLYDDLIVPVVFGAIAKAEAYKVAFREIEAHLAAQEKDQSRRQEESADFARGFSEASRKAEEISSQPEFINKIISRYERESGLKFHAEIEKCLGNEITVAYGISGLPAADGKEPATHMAAFIGLRDREAAQLAINKLIAWMTGPVGSMPGGNTAQAETESAGDPPKEKTDEQLIKEQEQRLALMKMMPREKYKNAEIMSLTAFATGYVDNYLIIADSTDTIKRMLDNAERDHGIMRDANFATATMSMPATMSSRVYVGPKYFDEMLSGFIRAWAAVAPDESGYVPLNLSATLAATVSADANGFRLEAFTPIGIPALLAFDSLTTTVKSNGAENELAAQMSLKTIAGLQEQYAAAHQHRFATLEQLIRFQKSQPQAAAEKQTEQELDGAVAAQRNLESLKEPDGNYRYAVKVHADGKHYQATATPIRYGRNGRLSFFVNESGQLRKADKHGEPADARDEPVNEGKKEN